MDTVVASSPEDWQERKSVHFFVSAGFCHDTEGDKQVNLLKAGEVSR